MTKRVNKTKERLTKEFIGRVQEQYAVTKNGDIFNKKNGKIKSSQCTGGSIEKYYLYTTIMGLQMPTHRWIMVILDELNGDNYDMEVNHRNTNRLNNEIENLELITKRQNLLHYKIRKILIDCYGMKEDYKLSAIEAIEWAKGSVKILGQDMKGINLDGM